MNNYDAIRLLSRNLAPGRPRKLCSIPSRFKVLFVYSTASRSTLGPLTLICNACRCVKLIRHLSSPQVQNAWSCTTIPACLHSAPVQPDALRLPDQGLSEHSRRTRSTNDLPDTRNVQLGLLLPDTATGTADVTSGVADSDVRASGTRYIVFGIGTNTDVMVLLHACCTESHTTPPPPPPPPPPPHASHDTPHNHPSLKHKIET
jgi:hypothetical protein